MISFLKTLLVLALLVEPAAQAARRRKRPVRYQVYDKITLIASPLMKRATVAGHTVTFTWDEPHWDFRYYLELYKRGQKKPFHTKLVRGGVRKVRFKKQKAQLFWRVRAVSRYGNRTKNRKIFLIPMK